MNVKHSQSLEPNIICFQPLIINVIRYHFSFGEKYWFGS